MLVLSPTNWFREIRFSPLTPPVKDRFPDAIAKCLRGDGPISGQGDNLLEIQREIPRLKIGERELTTKVEGEYLWLE